MTASNPPLPALAQERAAMRKHFRALRRNINAQDQGIAAARLSEHVATSPYFKSADNITAYLADQGEISLEPVIQLAWSQEKNVFLPVIDSDNAMQFVLYKEGDQLVEGRYGISIPGGKPESIQLSQLDLILAPLVAFDARGNRLGQGGGYYDRFLAGINTDTQATGHRPFILGVAHSCQQAEALPAEQWDMPLEAVATDTAIIHFS